MQSSRCICLGFCSLKSLCLYIYRCFSYLPLKWINTIFFYLCIWFIGWAFCPPEMPFFGPECRGISPKNRSGNIDWLINLLYLLCLSTWGKGLLTCTAFTFGTYYVQCHKVYIDIFTLNHEMVWVGRGLWGSSSSKLLPWAGSYKSTQIRIKTRKW